MPALKAAMAKYHREDILIVVGGVIPPQDYAELKEKGASFIFGPGTVISEAALTLLEILLMKFKKGRN